MTEQAVLNATTLIMAISLRSFRRTDGPYAVMNSAGAQAPLGNFKTTALASGLLLQFFKNRWYCPTICAQLLVILSFSGQHILVHKLRDALVKNLGWWAHCKIHDLLLVRLLQSVVGPFRLLAVFEGLGANRMGILAHPHR